MLDLQLHFCLVRHSPFQLQVTVQTVWDEKFKVFLFFKIYIRYFDWSLVSPLLASFSREVQILMH